MTPQVDLRVKLARVTRSVRGLRRRPRPLHQNGPVDNFQVDLRGIVEILSRHLYSSPRVFVRELLQNGVDAVTARRELDPRWQGHLRITVAADGTVRFADNGIGLTAAEVRELLATIGRSSKRDELDLQREGFLGQFGIGLLSCFLVSDTIEVRTRSARSPDAPTLLWVARGDGTYELSETDPLPSAGSEVTLRPRRGEAWLRPDTVRDLARHYGALLPMPITFSDDATPTRIAPRAAAWELSAEDAEAYCHATFGFSPLARIPLAVPVAGIRGVAFVLPTPANPSEQTRHRVYLRRMLLGESVAGLLPDWASFARVVVDVESLKPTASREALYDDANLRAARRELGLQLRRWLVHTNDFDPHLLRRVMDVHALGVSAAALVDDDVLQVVRDVLRWQTSTGSATLTEVLRSGKTLRFAATSRDFDALQAVAAGRGDTVLNASYTYGLELLRRLREVDPDIELRGVGLSDLLDDDAAMDADLRELVRLGSRALAELGCEVEARPFQPAGTPALYVSDPQRAARARTASRRSAAAADPLFADLLGATDTGDSAGDDVSFDTLVLNTLNPVIAKLRVLDPALTADVVRHLYATAVHSNGSSVGGADRALLTSSLLRLVERAAQSPHPGPQA